MYMMRNKKEVVMRKYNNLGGVDLGGLSMTDPVRYRKINAVLNDKGKKKDLLDRVETVPLEYVYDLANDSPSPEDNAILSELKVDTTAALGTLKPREEWVLRKRFGIGLPTDYTLNEIGKGFSVTTERIRQIEAKALRKLKHPSRKNKLKSSLTF
jgi:RNA polymerase sigma factor (sigma-70 family)